MATSLLVFIGFVVLFVLPAILGPLFGADSRDGRDWWSAERRMHNGRPSAQDPTRC